jgi:two-component system, OmpR family, sensor histidine kinase KdpD
LIRGNAAVGFGLHPIIFRDFVNDGLAGNVKTIHVEDLSYSGGEIAGLYKNAPHPNAAKLFLNWLLSQEGQIAWSSNIGNNSARRPSELRVLQLVADRVATAIERARLHEAEQQAHAAARQAVTVRDEFLAHASHELRTPLAHIKGFVSSLRQTDVGWDDDTRSDFLAEIEREADRLAKMISDLLDMSRLESGGLAPGDRTRATPREIVDGGIDHVRGLIANRSVEIDIPADLPNVLVDVDQVERVIANLVENAAKYSPMDTPIRASARRGATTRSRSAWDEGPGIPDGSQERIFEKFMRAVPPDARVPGTGLGLAISRHIARMHGGELCARNLKPGARFILRLPRTAVKEVPDGPRAHSDRRRRSPDAEVPGRESQGPRV